MSTRSRNIGSALSELNIPCNNQVARRFLKGTCSAQEFAPPGARERSIFSFYQSRFVSSGINDAKESERLVIRIIQLVYCIGRDIDRIKVFDESRLASQPNFALASDADNNMFMPVTFQTAITSTGQLKIPQMEFSAFSAFAYQDIAGNIRPSAIFLLVPFRDYAGPPAPTPVTPYPVIVGCCFLAGNGQMPIAGRTLAFVFLLFLRHVLLYANPNVTTQEILPVLNLPRICYSINSSISIFLRGGIWPKIKVHCPKY